jgi:hypothetical protein
MKIIEFFCGVANVAIRIITFSSWNDEAFSSGPLQIPLATSLGLSAIPYVDSNSGPIFRPPGTPNSSSFQCDYSSMVGWESCSTPTNRKCWLRRTSDWKQYDIFTDYENEMPNGTTRFYEIDIQDSWFDADGLNFTEAKLFNNQYPGPWIEACWGDRYEHQSYEEDVDSLELSSM